VCCERSCVERQRGRFTLGDQTTLDNDLSNGPAVNVTLFSYGTVTVDNLAKTQVAQHWRRQHQWPNGSSFKFNFVQRLGHSGTSLAYLVPLLYHKLTLIEKCGIQV
jgi:hypothetical protein